MVLSLRLAGLVSTTIQGILYGIAIVMYLLTVWILVKNGQHQRINSKMIVAACALLFFATTEVIVNIFRISEGFISVGPMLQGGPEQYFEDVTETTFILKNVLFNTQTLILDAVVIYRAYIVWQNIVPVLVPIFGWFGLLIAAIGTNVALMKARSGHQLDIFFHNTAGWITANYASTLVTNVSASCLLAYRIWYLSHGSLSIRIHGHVRPVVHAIIESGFLYSVTITSALIAFVLKSPGQNVIWDMASPIILITFCMIIVRIGLSSQSTLNVGMDMATPVSVGNLRLPCRCRFGEVNATVNRDGMYNLKPLAVEVTHFQEVQTDVDMGMNRMGSRNTVYNCKAGEGSKC